MSRVSTVSVNTWRLSSLRRFETCWPFFCNRATFFLGWRNCSHDFQTWTLKYNRVHWITIDELREHWSRARLDAEIKSKSVMEISTLGINAFSIDMRPGKCPLDATRMPLLIIDGQQVVGLPIKTDRSLSCRMCQHDGKWQICDHHDDGLRKRHHLQGPIDDAFMDAFLIVRPTGKSRHQKVAEWVTAELEHAAVHWRQQFRGEARIKDDTQVL